MAREILEVGEKSAPLLDGRPMPCKSKACRAGDKIFRYPPRMEHSARFGSRPLHALALLLPLLLLSGAAFALELGLPAQCTPGTDCFVQQYPDMDAAQGAASDPFCGPAAYDGHDGTDLRVLSMADVARGVPVMAMADGTVLRSRDGEPDRLVQTEADRAAVADKECGNGMIVDLGGGIEVQYCHMRQASLVVKPGEAVKRGQKLGEVGASGLAQFPHVHVTVRRDGKAVDPSTGRDLSAGCLKTGATAEPLFSPDVLAALGNGEAQLIAFGFAGGPIDHAALPLSGPPPQANSASPAFVGWGWFINLRAGDIVVVRLSGPDGQELAVSRSDPMNRSKADFSAFAGKKGSPRPGAYTVKAAIERDGSVLFERSDTFTLE